MPSGATNSNFWRLNPLSQTSKAKHPQKLPSTVSKNRPAKLKRKDFEKQLEKLQAELVKASVVGSAQRVSRS